MSPAAAPGTLEGGCLCGSVRYIIQVPPRRATHCHCLHCRGASGAPLVTWLECDAGAFRITAGEPACYSSRPGVSRRFCGRCGTQLTFQDAATPGAIDVTACSLDDVTAVRPQDHVWCDRMVPWLALDDDLPRYRRRRCDH